MLLSLAEKLGKENAEIDGIGVHFGGLDKGFKLRVVHHAGAGRASAFPLRTLDEFEKKIGFRPVVRRVVVPEKMELDVFPKLSIDSVFRELHKLEGLVGSLSRQKVIYTMVGKVDASKLPLQEIVEFGEAHEVPMLGFKEGELYSLAVLK